MAVSFGERSMRRVLPLLRLGLAYFPLRLARRLETLAAKPVLPLPAGMRREVVLADGVTCEWLIPEHSTEDTVLLYLHGGGFVYGWTDVHRRMVMHLAQLAGVRALAVDYRLAPEHPFPAALEDCATVYRWLLKQEYPPERIVIAGDSAGGNLTLTTMLKLRDSGDPLPAAAVCLSPATDLVDESDFANGYDPLLHPRTMQIFRDSYIPNHDPHDPLLSPVFADLHGLPPLLVQAGEDELLRSHSVKLAAKAEQAGIDVRLKVYPRMWHVWQLNFWNVPQAQQALEEIAQFLKAHVNLTPSRSLPR